MFHSKVLKPVFKNKNFFHPKGTWIKTLLLAGGFVAGFCACVSSPSLSPQQRRALQVKGFSASYNHVFRAFKTVLQDEGYIIKNQDMQGGLIVAEASQRGSAAVAFLSALSSSGPSIYRTGTTYSVSVNLEAIRKDYVESRVIIQKKDSYSMGGQTGNEILSPALYKNIYSKVQVEIARRKAQNK